MGSSLSAGDKVEPRELHDIHKYYKRSGSGDGDEIKSQIRSTTDVFFLILMTAFMLGLTALLVYCILNGDLYRILNGYDNCANICGRLNEKNQKYTCMGIDMKTKPYLLIKGSSGSVILSNAVERQCVTNCTEYAGYREFLNRCIPEKSKEVVNRFFSKTGLRNFFQEVSEDLHLCWREIIYMCNIALVFSLLIMILFRYVVGVVVWLVLIAVSLACCLGTAYLWFLWNRSRQMIDVQPRDLIPDIDSRKSGTYLCFSILASIVTIIVLLVILVMRKRIQLVIQLFKEAGRAVTAMPLLLFEPILTFISLAFVIALWFYFSLWIESSGFLTEHKSNNILLNYDKNFLIKFTRWYNLLAMLWMVQFVIACQHMVIAGAVSIWYFTRDKNRLGTPILYSLHNLTRYHLGSVALGSLIIAVIQFLRVVLKLVEKYLKSHQGKCVDCTLKCCQCCLYCFEKVIKFLNRNAYIETAMYGYTFCRAGRQAFRLLVANALRVTAINSVGDFVLFLGKVLVVMATVIIGIEILQKKEGLQHMWVPVTLAGLFAYFVAHCFITVYEMAIDTIFLCFCEDCEQNDGIGKPYYMSRGLMEFVENSKKALDRHDSKTDKKVNRKENVPTISGTISH